MNMRRLSAMALLAAATALAGCDVISTGNVGVSAFAGKTNPEELQPGFNLTWMASVDEFTTKQVNFPVENMRPKAKGGLTMEDLDMDVYVSVKPNKVAEVLVKYQGDMAEADEIDKDAKVSAYVVGAGKIRREIREAIYTATAEFDPLTLHSQRSELAARVVKLLQASLDSTDPDTWVVESANVRQVTADNKMEAAIREAQQMDKRIEAKQKETLLAKEEAARLAQVAQGEAQANLILAASITDRLLELKRIEAQAAFAKQGTHTVLMGGGQPLVSVGR